MVERFTGKRQEKFDETSGAIQSELEGEGEVMCVLGFTGKKESSPKSSITAAGEILKPGVKTIVTPPDTRNIRSFHKSPDMLQIEKIQGRPIEEILRELRYAQMLTYQEIAKEIGKNESTVRDWIMRMEGRVPVKSKSEVMKQAWMEKREWWVTRTQSPEAKLRRVNSARETLKKKNAENPPHREILERIRMKLGENPLAELERRNSVLGMTQGEIAKEIGVPIATLQHWIKVVGYEFVRRKTGTKTVRNTEKWKSSSDLVRRCISSGIFYKSGVLTSHQQDILRRRFIDIPENTMPTIVDIARDCAVSKQAVNDVLTCSLRRLQAFEEGEITLKEAASEPVKVRRKPGPRSALGENPAKTLDQLINVQGLDDNGIVAALHVSYRTVRKWKKENGFNKHKKSPKN